MENAYKLAFKKSQERGTRAKGYYDRKLCSSVLQHKDCILVCNLSQQGGPGKLQGPDSPVYEVKPESGTGPTCVLHQNYFYHMILFLWTLTLPKQESEQVASRRQRQFKCQLPAHLRSQAVQEPFDEESSPDEDNDIAAMSRPTRPAENSPHRVPSGATSGPEVTPEGDIDNVASSELPETVKNQQMSGEWTGNQVRPSQNEHIEPGADSRTNYTTSVRR